MKIYRVLVVQEVGGNMYIEADNATDAGQIARKLLNGGRAIVDEEENEGFKVEDAQEVTAPESAEKKSAGENAEALAELEAERVA